MVLIKQIEVAYDGVIPVRDETEGEFKISLDNIGEHTKKRKEQKETNVFI